MRAEDGNSELLCFFLDWLLLHKGIDSCREVYSKFLL